MRLIKLLFKFLKPENVDLNSIRCVLEDNRLTVVANVSSGFQKKVPIEFIQKEKMTQGAKEQQSQEIQSKESQMNLPEKEGPLKEPCPSCFQKSVPIESKGSEIMTEHENEEKNRESQTNIPEQKGLLKRFSVTCYGHQKTVAEVRSEKAEKFRELKVNRNSKEFEEWFLSYRPGDSKNPAKKQIATKKQNPRNKTFKTKNYKSRRNIEDHQYIKKIFGKNYKKYKNKTKKRKKNGDFFL